MDKQLLQKYISGSATEEEARRVTEWIYKSENNRRIYMAQRKLFDIYLWHSPSKTVKRRSIINIHIFKKVSIRIMEVAAMIALIIIGTYFWIYNWQSKKAEQMQSIYVPVGQRSEILLTDGTKVWLNSRSKLTFPSTFYGKYRKVKLDGEGYFIVTKNRERPFIVETDKYNVKVLGTEFNVTAYSLNNTWRTSLLRGSVEIDSPQGFVQMKLSPNDMATYNGNKLVKSTIEDDEYYRWREGLICFDNVSIKEIIDRLEICYGVNIVVNDKQMLSKRYTGKFWISDGIEQVFKVLSLDNSFTYHKDENTNAIIIN
jgi:transmembrane sensor